MTRKILLATISLIYMVFGFLNFFNSLFPAPSQSGLFVIRLFPLIGSVLAFYAGIAMFRLNEFGRKLVIFWLSIRVAINTLLILRLPMDGAQFRVENYLGVTIYKMDYPYSLQGFLLIWIMINLLIIVFLSQKETRKLFAPEEKSNVEPDIVFE